MKKTLEKEERNKNGGNDRRKTQKKLKSKKMWKNELEPNGKCMKIVFCFNYSNVFTDYASINLCMIKPFISGNNIHVVSIKNGD